jgi:hypothetical protein
LKHLSCRKYSFQKLTQLSQGNSVLDAHASNLIIFFLEIHAFLQLSWICLFGAMETIFTMETINCKEYSFQNPTQFSQGNHVLDVPASNTDGFLLRDTSVSSTWLNRPTWSKESLSPPWKLICRKFSFQTWTKFSQWNNVLDAPASNTDSFLLRYTCANSTYLKRAIWNKMSLSPPWKLWFAGCFTFKN